MTARTLPVWVTRQNHLAIVTTQAEGHWVVTMCTAAAGTLLGRKLQVGQAVKGSLAFIEEVDEEADRLNRMAAGEPCEEPSP